MLAFLFLLLFFFFNDTATTEIYTLSLHDALPISRGSGIRSTRTSPPPARRASPASSDRKSTRLNSSHTVISYAVFCLKKKKKHRTILQDKLPELMHQCQPPEGIHALQRDGSERTT